MITQPIIITKLQTFTSELITAERVIIIR